MERKHTRAISVKGKLISALCMLLVAVIMVVSSTYAWFTLSTAPEVTGISTSIGANGALEMRLNRTGYSVTDGTKTVDNVTDTDINTTWGNIVRLSTTAQDGSVTVGYGLDKITLLPSTMLTDAGKFVELQAPKYGDDGRPSSDAMIKAVTGVYNGSTGFNTDDSQAGVRAVGVASGLSERQLAWRNATRDAKAASDAAKNMARNSLVAHGSLLANAVIRQATVDGAKFTVAELKALGTIIDAFGYNYNNGTDDVVQAGLLDELEEAYVALYIGAAAKGFDSVDGDKEVLFTAFVSSINGLADIVEPAGESYTFKTVSGYTPSGMPTFLEAVKDFYTIKKNVELAHKAYVAELDKADDDETNDATEEAYVWADFNNVLTYLVSATYMKVNGYTAAEIRGSGADAEDSKMNNLVQDVASGKGLTVTMTDGAGIFEALANHTGNYETNVSLSVEYGSMNLTGVAAKMKTDSEDPDTAYITDLSGTVSGLGQPVNAASATSQLEDFYGYIIDLAFRTNAAESNLLLQVAEKDRIYADNENELTQGHGSNMTFTTDATDFGDAAIKNLMSSIRIVFFETGVDNDGKIIRENKTILAYARLDATNATTDANGTKANLFICDANGTAIEGTDANKIVALNQNNEHKISVLVYLEGDPAKGGVDNSDVAATVAKSVSGNLNLQFASSATLVPMEYGDLHIQGSESASN